MFTGLAAYLVYEYAPTARGSGIPEAGMGELDMHLSMQSCFVMLCLLTFHPTRLIKEQSSNIPRTICHSGFC